MQIIESNGLLIIQGSAGMFVCPVTEFLTYEPTYQPLAPDYRFRRWHAAVQCVSDGTTQTADAWFTPERMTFFCGRVAEYQALYDAAHAPIPEPEEEEVTP